MPLPSLISALEHLLIPSFYLGKGRGPMDLEHFVVGLAAQPLCSCQKVIVERGVDLDLYLDPIEQVEEYETILREESLVLDIIREDLYEIKDKYGDDRRMVISDSEVA